MIDIPRYLIGRLKISVKDRWINEKMSEKLFAKMIFLLFYITKQLFIQIVCKNRLQEIMNIPLSLTHRLKKSDARTSVGDC